MPRVTPAWLSGYAGMIVLASLLVNISTSLVHNGYGLVLPPMRDTLGLSHFQEGLLITGFSISSMIANVASGFLTPRYGTRLIVGVSSIGGGISLIVLGASPNFMFALVISTLMGFTMGGMGTPIMGLLVGWFDARTRGRAAGLTATGSGFSFIIMGALVPWLTNLNPEDGWRHTWYVMGVVVMLTGVISVGLLRENPRAQEMRRRSWPLTVFKSRPIWILMFLTICSGWCQGLYTTFFGVYLEEQGVGLAVSGRLWGLLGLASIGSGLIWGTMSDRIGRRSGFLFSYAIYTVGLLLFWLAPVMAGFIVSVAIVALVFRANYVVSAAACADYMAPPLSTAAFGFVGMGIGIGRSIGPPVGGGLADATGDLGWAFALAAIGAILGVIIAWVLPRPSSLKAPAPTLE